MLLLLLKEREKLVQQVKDLQQEVKSLQVEVDSYKYNSVDAKRSTGVPRSVFDSCGTL